MNSHITFHWIIRLLMPFCFCICTFLISIPTLAQEKPPKPIVVTVSTLQHLSFGKFIQTGTNGTVTVTPQGGRMASGSVILPTMFSVISPALFEVEALPGTLITINNGPDVTLTSSEGGILILKVGEASTGSPFIVNNDHTDVFIGGTLTVGPMAANPAGDYGGTFEVTFIQQ